MRESFGASTDYALRTGSRPALFMKLPLQTWILSACAPLASLLQWTSLPMRLPSCPSRFVPAVAFLFNALSHTTRAHSRAKARSGVSPVPTGDSLVIYRSDQRIPSRWPSRFRMRNESRYLKRWCDGQEARSSRLRMGGATFARLAETLPPPTISAGTDSCHIRLRKNGTNH
jgi:hypothetical protein